MNKNVYFIRGIGVGIIISVIVFFIVTKLSPTTPTLVSQNSPSKNINKSNIIESENQKNQPSNISHDKEDTKESSDVLPNDIETESSVTESPDTQDDTGDNSLETKSEDSMIMDAKSEKTTSDINLNKDITFININVLKGWNSYNISKELFNNGLIDDADTFNSYCIDNQYSKKLRSGTFSIPEGSTYDEIILILTRKKKQA